MLEHIPDILVHMTRISRLKSIKQNGLVPGSKRNSIDGTIRGIYLALEDILDCDATGEFNFSDKVILHIDVTSIKHLLKPDPEWRPDEKDNPNHLEDDMCWYIEQTIPPSLIVKAVF